MKKPPRHKPRPSPERAPGPPINRRVRNRPRSPTPSSRRVTTRASSAEALDDEELDAFEAPRMDHP
jgi:hypothetical protein